MNEPATTRDVRTAILAWCSGSPEADIMDNALKGRACLLSLVLASLVGVAHANDNWPQWRGPMGSGSSDSTGLPTEWDAENNVIWKAALPSWASSTPIIWGDRIYLVTPSKPKSEGAAEAPEGGDRILLLCFSLDNGSLVWEAEAAGRNHMFRKHNASTPSPVTDGKHIWVVTGQGSITAFGADGKSKWSFDLAKAYGENGARHGYASSPVVHDGRLFVQMIHGYSTDAPSYVMAFNGATGEILWHKERDTDVKRRTESRDAYTTPLVATIDGKPQLVVVGADYITGHDLANGDELWRVGGLNPDNHDQKRLVASSIVHGDRLFVPSRKGPILALDLKKLAVADDSLVWEYNEGTLPDVPSPVTDGDYLFMADDQGAVSCLDAKSGKLMWGPEDTSLGRTSSSMVLADGKIYLSAETGATAVVAAGPEYKMLAINKLDGSYTLSSPAITDDRVLIRTAEYLYCIGNP